MQPPEKKSRSGTQWGDAEYAAKGYGRITLRLPLTALAALDQKAEQAGCSRTQLVIAAVERFEVEPAK